MSGAAPDVFWTTRVPAELDERLETQAEVEDRTKAAIVRRAVERYLDEELGLRDVPPEFWRGYRDGEKVAEYGTRREAEQALRQRIVDSIAPVLS